MSIKLKEFVSACIATLYMYVLNHQILICIEHCVHSWCSTLYYAQSAVYLSHR